MRYLQWVILLFGLSTNPGLAQSESDPGAIKIVAKEKGTGKPLRKVEAKFEEKTLYSKPSGEIKLPASAAGKAIQIHRFGFEKQTVTAPAAGGSTNIYLVPTPPDDNEVRVIGKRRPEVSRKTVSADESAKVAPGGDPVQVAKLLPGVQTTSGPGAGFDGRVVIRGSGPEDSVYYVDDIPVPFIFHSIGSISITPEPIIKDLDFSTGGFGPRYGDATGGVIVVRTKSEIPEDSNLEIRVNIPIYSGVFYETPLSEDSALSASFRRSYIQYLLPTFLDATDNVFNISVVPFFGDAHVQYVKVHDKGHHKVSFFNAHDGLKLTGSLPLTVDETGNSNIFVLNSFSVLSYNYLRRLPKRWTLSTTPALFHSKMENDILGNKFNIGSYGINLPVEAVKRFDRYNKLYLGIEMQRSEADLDLFIVRPTRTDPFFDFEEAPKLKRTGKFSGMTAAAWVSVDRKLGDFILSPGIRAYYHSEIEDRGLDPRFNLRYLMSKETNLKLALGQYSKPPEDDEADEVFGNPDLSYERSYHYIAGVEHKISDKWSAEFQVFYKQLKDAVVEDDSTVLANKGKGRTKGAEVFVRRHQTARTFGWFAYTWSKNEVWENDETGWITSQFDQTHVLTAAGHRQLTATWGLGGRLTYKTGDPYTAPDEVVYNASLDKYQRRTAPANKNSKRLPDASRVSVYAEKDLLMDEWKMQLRFGIEEYLIGKDGVTIDYNYDYSEMSLVEGIPAIPYLELRAKI